MSAISVSVLYPELTRGLNACNEVQFERKLESPATSGDEGVPNLQKHCPSCVRTSEDYGMFLFVSKCPNETIDCVLTVSIG